MQIIYYAIVIGAAVAVIAAELLFVRGKPRLRGLYQKGAALALAAVFTVRYMTGPEAVGRVVKIFTGSPFNSAGQTITGLLITWLVYAAVLVAMLQPFFSTKTMGALLKFFALPIALAQLVLLSVSQIAVVGADAAASGHYRAVLMCAELGLLLYICAHEIFKNGFRTDGKALLSAALWALPVLFTVMPIYLPQALFGVADASMRVIDFTLYHRLHIYAGLLITLGLYFALKNKSFEEKRLVLLLVSIGTLITFSYNYKFAALINPVNWPLHLCNTAMYIVVACLIFRLEKVVYFTFFVNVLGTFLAMLMPNGSPRLLSSGVVVFWYNHIIAFAVPILLIALKIYKRPKLREFFSAVTVFAIYYGLMLIINAWFTNYNANIDFFFLNSDFVASKLGKWAESLLDIAVSFNIGDLTFKLYPLYQIPFFIVYVALAAGVWFVYEQWYVFADQLGDIAARLRTQKAARLEIDAVAGADKGGPSLQEGENQLRIEGVSKRYPGSEIYAVKDADLTVSGGEVFGFLGPNGAGKSTIIKAVVGMHPITEGKIFVCGCDAERQPMQAKRLIGFVPDHYALYENLTGREYIEYTADMYGVSALERAGRIDNYVEMFELTQSFGSAIATYSHGMKQKLAIMAALVHNPKVWILDEPLTGLDPTSIYQVKEVMKQHAREGNIVFFSSHIIDVVEKVCDRVAVIKGGRIQACKPLREIERGGSLEQFYLQAIGEK